MTKSWLDIYGVILLMIFWSWVVLEASLKSGQIVITCLISHFFITFANYEPVSWVPLSQVWRPHFTSAWSGQHNTGALSTYLVLWYQNPIPSSSNQQMLSSLHSSPSHSFGITSARSISQLVPKSDAICLRKRNKKC